MHEIIAIVVFAVVMSAIMTEKLHRTAAAIAGAVVLMLTHVLDVEKAVSYIDFNTIGVLIGMMIFVAVVKECGVFEYVSVKAAKIAHGDPWKILVLFMIFTAVLSAFLDNVTTVLLVGPMTITIAAMLEVNPIPILLCQIFASNIGGTATLIGDPPNIMIGSAAGLDFLDFVENTGLVVVVIMIVLCVVMRFVYKKKLVANKDAIAKVMALNENDEITNKPLLIKSMVMMLLVVLGFIFHSQLGIESSTVALTAAAVMMVIGHQKIETVISEVEWPTILFFVGLFVVVGGLSETGVIKQMADFIVNTTSGHPVITMLVILWASAILSSFLDNIPFVATMIPLVLVMGTQGIDTTPLWWAISLGACLGGNGTLIGASANVVLSGISTRQGYPITFKEYTKVGFPIMILTVFISMIYLLVKFA